MLSLHPNNYKTGDSYVSYRAVGVFGYGDVRCMIGRLDNSYSKSIDINAKPNIQSSNNLTIEPCLPYSNKTNANIRIIKTEIYHIGASLKDLGKKWFAFSKIGKDAKEMLNKLE